MHWVEGAYMQEGATASGGDRTQAAGRGRDCWQGCEGGQLSSSCRKRRELMSEHHVKIRATNEAAGSPHHAQQDVQNRRCPRRCTAQRSRTWRPCCAQGCPRRRRRGACRSTHSLVARRSARRRRRCLLGRGSHSDVMRLQQHRELCSTCGKLQGSLSSLLLAQGQPINVLAVCAKCGYQRQIYPINHVHQGCTA